MPDFASDPFGQASIQRPAQNSAYQSNPQFAVKYDTARRVWKCPTNHRRVSPLAPERTSSTCCAWLSPLGRCLIQRGPATAAIPCVPRAASMEVEGYGAIPYPLGGDIPSARESFLVCPSISWHTTLIHLRLAIQRLNASRRCRSDRLWQVGGGLHDASYRLLRNATLAVAGRPKCLLSKRIAHSAPEDHRAVVVLQEDQCPLCQSRIVAGSPGSI